MKDYGLEKYGLKPMGFAEEAGASENIGETRRDKVRMIDDCAAIIQTAEKMIERARRIPEEDDDNHAKLVTLMADSIHSVRITLDIVLRA